MLCYDLCYDLWYGMRIEFIHSLVETMDKYFESVCELDVREGRRGHLIIIIIHLFYPSTPSIHSSIYPSILSVHQSIHTINPFIYLSIHTINPFIYLSIHTINSFIYLLLFVVDYSQYKFMLPSFLPSAGYNE